MARHFVDLFDLDPDDARALIDRAARPEARARRGGPRTPYLPGRTLGLIFEKPSLRTRVSFEAAIAQLGGNAIFLRDKDVGMGSRESVADFARVISQYVDALAVRTYAAVDRRGAGAVRHRPDRQRPVRPGAPVPGDGRHAHDPRGPGPARRREARLRRRRQQRRAVAGPGLGPAGRPVRAGVAAGLRVPRGLPRSLPSEVPRRPARRRPRPGATP